MSDNGSGNLARVCNTFKPEGSGRAESALGLLSGVQGKYAVLHPRKSAFKEVGGLESGIDSHRLVLQGNIGKAGTRNNVFSLAQDSFYVRKVASKKKQSRG